MRDQIKAMNIRDDAKRENFERKRKRNRYDHVAPDLILDINFQTFQTSDEWVERKDQSINGCISAKLSTMKFLTCLWFGLRED